MQLKDPKQRVKLLLFFMFVQAWPCWIFGTDPGHDKIKNICEYLGGRSDKNLLGNGNMAVVIEPDRTKTLFIQQWKEKALMDWASGTVREWFPDRIEMNEAVPPIGATISHSPNSRTVFITRDDVAGMQLV